MNLERYIETIIATCASLIVASVVGIAIGAPDPPSVLLVVAVAALVGASVNVDVEV